MKLILAKGSVIESGTSVNQDLFRYKKQKSGCNFKSTLYYSADDIPPIRRDESVKKLCDINWSPQTKLYWELRYSTLTNSPYYFLIFEVRVKVDGPTLTFEVVHGGTTAATGSVLIEFE